MQIPVPEGLPIRLHPSVTQQEQQPGGTLPSQEDYVQRRNCPMSQSFSSSPRTSSLSDKVRVLIAGPELIAASLNTLLAGEQDMEVRTPLPDIREVLEVTVRMRRLQRPVDV